MFVHARMFPFRWFRTLPTVTLLDDTETFADRTCSASTSLRITTHNLTPSIACGAGIQQAPCTERARHVAYLVRNQGTASQPVPTKRLLIERAVATAQEHNLKI